MVCTHTLYNEVWAGSLDLSVTELPEAMKRKQHAVKTPVTGCESCQALSALFPIAGARAANTVKKITIATNVATTKGKKPNFRFS